MPTDEAQLNELLGRFAIDPDMTAMWPQSTDHIQVQLAPGPSTQRTAVSLSHGASCGSGPLPVGGPAWGSSTLMSYLRLGSSVQPGDVSPTTKRVS
jgi:hypothetical protein